MKLTLNYCTINDVMMVDHKKGEDNKWNKCLTMIAFYIIIIGTIIAIIQH